MTYPKEIIRKIYQSLPDELKSVVGTQETASINDEIAKAYRLNTKQRLGMGDEVTMRLIGVTTANSFISNLKTRLGISSEIAEKIKADVETKILSKVSVKVLHAQEEYSQSKLKETTTTSTKLPEVAPEIHPMVEKGEVAHNVPLAEEEEPSAASHKASAPANIPTQDPSEVPESIEELVEEPSTQPSANPVSKPEPKITAQSASEPKKEEVQVPPPPAKSPYPPGQDPYREPIE